MNILPRDKQIAVVAALDGTIPPTPGKRIGRFTVIDGGMG